MSLFAYRYIDPKGKKRGGVIDAITLLEAKEKLREQGVLVTSLEESSQEQKLPFWKKRKREVRGEALITFTTQLSQLLIAGVPLYESLLILEEQTKNEAYHPTLLNLCDQIKRGSSLSEAMEQFPRSFNHLYCSMVAAGESVGALDQTLEKLAHLLQKQSKLKKQIITALIYPALLFSFSCVVILLLLLFVIPTLETLFEDRNVNRFTKCVMVVSRFLTMWWMVYLPLLVGGISALIYYLTQPKGRRWLGRSLLRLPILSTLLIHAALARFCRTMGTLLQGGVTLLSALQIGRGVMRNPFLEEIVEGAEQKIIEGSLLSIELKKSSLIPSLLPRMLAIGEEGGNTPAMFQKVADLYEGEVDKTLTRVTALAQPVILIIMGGVVGIIMLAVLLPLTDVSAFM